MKGNMKASQFVGTSQNEKVKLMELLKCPQFFVKQLGFLFIHTGSQKTQTTMVQCMQNC